MEIPLLNENNTKYIEAILTLDNYINLNINSINNFNFSNRNNIQTNINNYNQGYSKIRIII